MRMNERTNVNTENLKKVSVIGAGHMGHGIAEVALLSNYFVSLVDISEERVNKGKALIDWSLKELMKKSKITEKRYKDILNNFETSTDLENAIKNTFLCIEAVPEKLELKKNIFKKLDKFSPKHAILASNTSTMSITEIANITQRPEKVVGLHFPPPPVLAKAVEIVKGEKTSSETINLITRFVKDSNKIPIISKDSPGFICNRIMAPSILLIQLMLDQKEYSPMKIDAAALNKKMIMGPYELLDYMGLDVVYDSSLYLAKTLSPDYYPTHTIKKFVEENKLGRKTGEGIYKWGPGGKRPDIDLSDPAEFDLLDLTRLQINEAVKVLEEGVGTMNDIEIGMKLFYHNQRGPFEIVKKMNLNDLTVFLDKISNKYGKEVFCAHKWIRDNTLLERISNKDERLDS